MNTAVDLINLSPSTPLGVDIPTEFRSKNKAKTCITNTRGCLTVFVHIPKDERFKLGNKIKSCHVKGQFF